MNKHLYADLLRHACAEYADRPALHSKRDGKYKTWTYADFHRDLNTLSSALKKDGLGKGKNGAVIGENSPEWVIAYHAILLTGACTVPIDPNIPASEIESIVATTEAAVVFCTPVYASLFRLLREKYGFLRKIVLLGQEPDEREPLFSDYLLGGDPRHDAFEGRFEPGDPMVIIFTSGTTGKAKGVVLCQKNYTAVSNYAIPRMKLGPGDTVLSVLPLHHVFGFAASIAGPLCGGMDVVFVPYMKGPLILEALRDKGVTMLPAVPKMISLFYDGVMHNVKKKGPLVSTMFAGMQGISSGLGGFLGDPFRRKLFTGVHKGFGGRLRLIISGGAALGDKYWNGFKLLGFNILEGYGLSETFGPITVCPADDPRLGSVGPALQENEISILDPNEDGIGEVLLRGSCVFSGYYKNEALTREVIDDKGWFHTGDLGRLDKDGFLHISGRKKDMIVLDSGKNVYPDELEAHYEHSPLVEEIGVFGVKNEEGEIVAAAIVPSKEIRKSHSVQQATDIIYHELVRLGKELPVYRRISDFAIVYQSLPRTTTRKLKKNELLKLYNSIKRKAGSRPVLEEQLSVMEMALMETAEYRGVCDSIAGSAPHIERAIITPRSSFEVDLGFDSLAKIELLSHIERTFGIEILEEVFEKMETVADLVTLVKEQKESRRPASVEKVISLKDRILDMSYYRASLPGTEKTWRRPAATVARTVAAALGGAGAEGLGALQGLKAPFIVVARHTSALDAFRILQALPREIAEATFFLAEPIDYPRLPYELYRRNAVTLQKPNDPIETLKASLAVLREGKNLISFPEGKIIDSEKCGEFKSGIGLIANETKAPLLPVLKADAGARFRFGTPFTIHELVSKGILKGDASPQEIANYIRGILLER